MSDLEVLWKCKLTNIYIKNFVKKHLTGSAKLEKPQSRMQKHHLNMTLHTFIILVHRTNANSHMFFLVIFGKRNPECNSEVCLCHGVSKAQMGGKPINLFWESIGLFFCCNCWRWVCPMLLLLHWKLQNQALALKMSFGYARSLKQKVVIFPFHPLDSRTDTDRQRCRESKPSQTKAREIRQKPGRTRSKSTVLWEFSRSVVSLVNSEWII